MNQHSVSSSRSANPHIRGDGDRSVSVSAADSSVTVTNSSSDISASECSGDSLQAAGRFNTGMIDGTANRAYAPGPTPRPAPASAQAPAPAPAQFYRPRPPTADSVAAGSDRAVDEHLPFCPTPVRRIIQGTSLLAGGGGLAMTIYGGIRINGEPVPELDPNRGQSIGLMVGGMLLLISGMIAFVTTQILRPTGDESGGTGSG